MVTLVKILVPLLWGAVTIGCGWVGWIQNHDWKQALAFAVAGFFGYLIIGMVVLVRMAGGETKSASVATPKEKKDWGMTLATWVIGALLLFAAVTAGAQMGVDMWVPKPNLTPMPQKCDIVLQTLGMDPKTVCPKTREEWRALIERKVTPFVSQAVWNKELEKALLGESCPETRAKVQGPATCVLDAGKFAILYSQYLDEKNEVLSGRWSLDGAQWMFVFAAILGMFNYFVPGLAIAALIRRPKLPLGKINATTFIGLVALMVVTLYPLLPLFGSASFSKPLNQLFWLGFWMPSAIVLIGGLTFGAGKLVSFLSNLRKGASFGIAFLLTVATILIVIGSEMLGLIPTWGQMIGIVQIMNENPGMLLVTAMQMTFAGSLAFTGLVSGIIGVAWTFASTVIGAERNAEAGKKLGF